MKYVSGAAVLVCSQVKNPQLMHKTALREDGLVRQGTL